MGTTADKLSYLAGTKEAIRAAILEKGVTVSDSDTFRSYAEKIAQIASGLEEIGSGYIIEPGTSVSIPIPSGASLFALFPNGTEGTRIMIYLGTISSVPDPINWAGKSFYVRNSGGFVYIESASDRPVEAFGEYKFYR